MYRIVVADSRSPRDGAFIEIIGHYYPLTNPETYDVNKEKVLKWLATGAKPTETVERLLIKSGVIEKKQEVTTKKSKPKKKAESKSKAVTEKTKETP